MLTPGERTHSAYHEIRVEGCLEADRAAWFEGMKLSIQAPEHGPITTVLRGLVADRAALHGLLSRIRDLGLHLVLVRRVDQLG